MATQQGRKVLLLTERTEHVNAIAKALGELVPEPFVLHGRMSKKRRATAIEQLSNKRQRGYRAMGYRVLPEFDSLRSDVPTMHTPNR